MIQTAMKYGGTALWIAGFLLVPLLSEAQDDAANVRERGWKIVAEGEVIDEDYGAVGEVVEISGTVNGDVYAAGGQIFVHGRVNGDLLAVGAAVHITGEVTQNVRAAGGQVLVSGTIGRNATVAAMHATFTDSANVQGSLVAGGANVFLAAPVGKEVRVGGRNFTLASVVGGDVEAAVEHMRITNRGRVEGDFTYWSNREAFVDEGAVVWGAQERKSPQQLTDRIGAIAEPVTSWLKPLLAISSFFTTLVLGLLLIWLFPRFSEATVHTLRTAKRRSFTTGVTALLLIPLLFGVLIITIVGIPLGFLLLLASSLILYVARIFVMLWAGELFFERWNVLRTPKRSLGAAFMVGLVLYSLLVFIPVIGWFVSFGAILFGLGALAETAKELYGKRKNATQA